MRAALLALILLVTIACEESAVSTVERSPQPLSLPSDALTVAYSPEKEDLFLELAIAFNLSRPDGVPPVHPVRVDMSEMLDRTVDGDFAAISPDSSVWLDPLDRLWQRRESGSSSLAASSSRYALSPIVIAMWEDKARELGYPDEKIGWEDLMKKVSEEPSFDWSHQAATTASGLLATTAEFYAGAGTESDLTQDDLERESTLEYVRDIESTVERYGGESEDKVVIRMLAEGGHPLDAFVAQEQTVVYFNRNTSDRKLMAVYPKEGTFWMDHPLVLLDGSWVTEGQRRAFRAFADFVQQPEQQRTVMQHGYRPGDVSASLTGPESLITPEYNVDPAQPKTLLKVPSAGVLEQIREAWRLTKKPANIVLVVDVSGSMQGEKLAGAKAALSSFVDQVQGDRDSVGLVAFSDEPRVLMGLQTLDTEIKREFQSEIRELDARGGTMLFDAAARAIELLDENGEPDEINVVVAMTDGRSEGSIAVLEEARSRAQVPVLLFTVGYGNNADTQVLNKLARMGEGEAYPSDPETIERLYKLLSEFF